MKRKDTLIFVEIKYRKNKDYLNYSINKWQMDRIKRSSMNFLKRYELSKKKNFSIQYDAILISGICNIKHIKNIYF